MVGIYKITNRINNKCYIGQSRCIEKRWSSHRSSCLDYPLYRAFRKYGLENFDFEIIEECCINELNNREIYWIAHFNSIDNGYNQTSKFKADSHYVKLSDETLDSLTNDLMNTTKTYDELSDIYNVRADYISLINLGKSWFREDYIYPLRDIAKEQSYCIDCGKENSSGSLRCSDCYHKMHRKVVERPTREELKIMIREKSFLAIGEQYNVSNTAIVKWCKSYNLPYTKKEIKQYSEQDWQLI